MAAVMARIGLDGMAGDHETLTRSDGRGAKPVRGAHPGDQSRDVARHRPDGVEARRQRPDAVEGNAAPRRLEAGRATAGRRDCTEPPVSLP